MSRGLVRTIACAGAAIAIAAAPSAAAAAGAKPKPKTSPTAPAATTPAAAKGAMKLYLPDAFFVSRQAVTVPNRVIHVGGVVRPYVPGQWVNVKVFQGSHRVKIDRLRIKPSANGRSGTFTEKLSVPRAGNTSVTIAHQKDAQQVGFVARRSFNVLEPSAGFGATGLFVQLMQQR